MTPVAHTFHSRLLSLTLGLSMALCFLYSCKPTPVIDTEPQQAPSYKENIINANKVIAATEETQIDAYVERRGWQLTRLGDGVRYQEYKTGHGKKLDFEEQAILHYRLEAINGSVIYAQQTDTITVGRHRPNEGVDHVLLQLRHGSQARVVVPSSMGYGVVGDGDRVPARAILIYDLYIE